MDGVGRLREAIDELAAMEPSALASMEDTVELSRQLERLDAVVTRAFGAFDASHDWMPSRCCSAAQWLAWQAKLPKSVAMRRQALARGMRDCPEVEGAWIAGEINGSHPGHLTKAAKKHPEPWARDRKILLDDARTMSYSGFYRALCYWLQLADPDVAEDDAQALRDKRRFHLSQSFEDGYFADGYFDPIGGSVIDAALKEIYDELFRFDWAAAKERLGREPTVDELGRTPAQRRADALMEMAIRAGTAPVNGRRPEPCFTVVMGKEVFERICELANGMVTTPGSLGPWLDQAWIERVIFGPRSRVLEVSERKRLFEGALRRAIEVRDGQCFHPACDTPAEDCEIDHIEPYAWGGPTTQDNGRAACSFHNRARHRRSGPPTP